MGYYDNNWTYRDDNELSVSRARPLPASRLQLQTGTAEIVRREVEPGAES